VADPNLVDVEIEGSGEALQVHFLISAHNYTRGCASYVTSSIRAELRQIQCPAESILHLQHLRRVNVPEYRRTRLRLD